MKKFKVLVLEGGGVKGLLAVLILKEVERLTGKKVHQLFDLIVGTSTGGLIASALTASRFGYEPSLNIEDLENIYMNETQAIFPQKGFIQDLRALFTSRYSTKPRSKVFKNYLKEFKLSSTLVPIIIPSYDLEENQPIFFKTRYTDETKKDPLLYDICMAASAASTYFKPHRFNYDGRDVRCIDAGLYINNPSLAAIFELSKHYKEYGLDEYSSEDMMMLSIGAGIGSIKPKHKDRWGTVRLIGDVIKVMFNGQARTTEYGITELLTPGNYLRVEFQLDPEHSEMDNSSPENMEYLADAAERYLDYNHETVINFLRTAEMI